MRTAYLLILLISLTVVVHDAEAGWKFWKKDKNKDDPSATEEALPSSTVSTTTSTTTTTTTTTTTPKPTTTTQKSDSSWKFWKKKKDEPSTTAKPSTATTAKAVATQKPSANRGIAAAADPALAIGVGNVGGKIREDARNQPRRPSPGTEVGLDIGQPKPQHPGLGPGGTGYRDWAADLAGVGQPGRQGPKLPDEAPALAPAAGRPIQGNRPASVPGTPTGQQPAAAPGSRPASPPGSPAGYPTPGNVGKPSPAVTPSTPSPAPANRPGTSTPTPAIRPSTPAAQPQRPTVAIPQPGPQVQPKPSSPGSPPASPTGTRSWAEVAGGGSKPGSPTPAPARSAQPSSPGARPGIATGAAVAGGAAVAAGAAAAAGAGATDTGKYSSNPTYSKGNTVTDEDLEKLSEALFIKDVNNANKFITLNLQKQTSGSSPKDEAPQPLLDVKPEALQIPTIQKVLAIYDNYKLDTREHEHISPAQRQEESLLIDTFLSTNVMSTAMRFLADKNFIKKDYYEYKDTLRAMWFNLYSRGEGRIGSTGFEHVFLTELKLGTEVSGLHNWIYFNTEETKKRLDYLGYIKKVDLGNKAAIAKVHVKFNGIDKPVTNIFIGTSPELEMALYTVCFFARPETKCPVSLGGTKFNIITHKFRYRGRDLIGSAYPDI